LGIREPVILRNLIKADKQACWLLHATLAPGPKKQLVAGGGTKVRRSKKTLERVTRQMQGG